MMVGGSSSARARQRAGEAGEGVAVACCSDAVGEPGSLSALSPAARFVTPNPPYFKPRSTVCKGWDLFLLLGEAGGDRGEHIAQLKSVFSIKRRKSSKTHSGLNVTVKSTQAALPLQSTQQFMCVIAGRWFLFVLKMSNPSSQRISSETIRTDLEVQYAF